MVLCREGTPVFFQTFGMEQTDRCRSHIWQESSVLLNPAGNEEDQSEQWKRLREQAAFKCRLDGENELTAAARNSGKGVQDQG